LWPKKGAPLLILPREGGKKGWVGSTPPAGGCFFETQPTTPRVTPWWWQNGGGLGTSLLEGARGVFGRFPRGGRAQKNGGDPASNTFVFPCSFFFLAGSISVGAGPSRECLGGGPHGLWGVQPGGLWVLVFFSWGGRILSPGGVGGPCPGERGAAPWGPWSVHQKPHHTGGLGFQKGGQTG